MNVCNIFGKLIENTPRYLIINLSKMNFSIILIFLTLKKMQYINVI